MMCFLMVRCIHNHSHASIQPSIHMITTFLHFFADAPSSSIFILLPPHTHRGVFGPFGIIHWLLADADQARRWRNPGSCAPTEHLWQSSPSRAPLLPSLHLRNAAPSLPDPQQSRRDRNHGPRNLQRHQKTRFRKETSHVDSHRPPQTGHAHHRCRSTPTGSRTTRIRRRCTPPGRSTAACSAFQRIFTHSADSRDEGTSGGPGTISARCFPA